MFSMLKQPSKLDLLEDAINWTVLHSPPSEFQKIAELLEKKKTWIESRLIPRAVGLE